MAIRAPDGANKSNNINDNINSNNRNNYSNNNDNFVNSILVEEQVAMMIILF